MKEEALLLGRSSIHSMGPGGGLSFSGFVRASLTAILNILMVVTKKSIVGANGKKPNILESEELLLFH